MSLRRAPGLLLAAFLLIAPAAGLRADCADEPSDLVARPGATPLTVERGAGSLEIAWEDLGDADEYSLYEGSLASLRGGVYDHAVTAVAVRPATSLPMSPADAYFLVSATCGGVETCLGRDSRGAVRPPCGCDFGCDVACGNDGNANVFGGAILGLASEIPVGRPNVIRITIPKVVECQDCPFTLYQLELGLQSISGAIPNFVRATIVDGLVGGSWELESPSTTGTNDDGTGPFGDADVDESEMFGDDGDMRLRWYQSFCTATGSCTYPKVRAGDAPLVVELEFEADACDITMTDFNFRVAVEVGDGDDNPEEMLCTNRPEGTDPHPPRENGVTNPDPGGGGRRLTDPAVLCAGCSEDCDPCYCPISQALDADGDVATMDDFDPTDVELQDDANAPFDELVLHFDQSACSTDRCGFEVPGLTIGLRAVVGRDCDPSTGIPLPTPLLADGAFVVHQDASVTRLGSPPDDVWEDWCSVRYRWSNIPGLIIADGESFDLVFLFAYSIGGYPGAERRDGRAPHRDWSAAPDGVRPLGRRPDSLREDQRRGSAPVDGGRE